MTLSHFPSRLDDGPDLVGGERYVFHGARWLFCGLALSILLWLAMCRSADLVCGS